MRYHRPTVTRSNPGCRPPLPLSLVYLNVPDVAALALTDDEILAAVEVGLRAQGEGRTVIGPREHLSPRTAADGAPIRGHFNVLRGHIATLDLAGVKIAGDHVDNYTLGLPSERGLLTLFDPRTDAGDSASGRRCATDERRRAAR